jgi:insulysin
MAPTTTALPPGDWRRVEATANRPGFSVFAKAVQKSPQDDREYRILQLENGLQVTLVSDPKGDKAAASLDVAVGHLSDPDDMPGLAHFCEHLLFMVRLALGAWKYAHA